MEDKQRDILLNAIKYLNIPLFYPGLNNAYVFNIDISIDQVSEEAVGALESIIHTVTGEVIRQGERRVIKEILECKIPRRLPFSASATSERVTSLSGRLTWLDNGSINNETSTGQLVLNPDNITSALKSNNLEAKEISVITQDVTNIILGIT